jgi:hypothetical protein
MIYDTEEVQNLLYLMDLVVEKDGMVVELQAVVTHMILDLVLKM